MVRWYLISKVNENGNIELGVYALKNKEIELFIKEYKVISICRINKKQALAFDKSWNKEVNKGE